MTRVALIDDHESVRLGLEAACARAGTTRVVFSGSTVRAYLRWHAENGGAPADVIVLDLTLGDGTTVTENVQRLVADGSSVLIHSVADRPTAVREALAAGAAGVISKASRIDDVLAAIRTIAAGEALDNIEWASAVEGDRAFADAQLSKRERDVLRLYAAGLPLKAVAERLRAEARRVHHRIDRKLAALASGETHQPSGLGVDEPLDLGAERDHAAAILEIALQGAHERMTVDDAGVGRVQRRHAIELRLHGAGCRAVDHHEALDAVGGALLEDRLHLADLGIFGGDDQLAAQAKRHAVGLAELHHQAPAARAVISAQRSGRVVHAAVDHFTVARRHAVADAQGPLGDDHLVALQRRRARDR